MDRAPHLAIDVGTLASTAFTTGSSDVMKFNPDYAEGLIDGDEAATKMQRQIGESGAGWIPHLQPAYLDGTGCMEALEYTTSQGNSVAIVGEVGAGRSHLISAFEAWQCQLQRSDPTRTQWQWRDLRTWYPTTPLSWSELEKGEESHSIVVLASSPRDNTLPKWVFSDGQSRSIQDLVALAQERPRQVRVSVVLEPAQYDAWYKQIPSFHQLVKFDVELQRRDWIPAWLRHLYAEDSRWAAGISLGDLFAFWEATIEPGEGFENVDEITGMVKEWLPEQMGKLYCEPTRLNNALKDLHPRRRRLWRTMPRRMLACVRCRCPSPGCPPHTQFLLDHAAGCPR